MTSPRHPGVETALTRDDIEQGVTYVTYIPGDRVIERGTFMSEADYNENDNRWNAFAIVQRGAHDTFNKPFVYMTLALHLTKMVRAGLRP